MPQSQIVPFDAKLALAAAKLSVDLKLLLADSVILAMARASRRIVDVRRGFCLGPRRQIPGQERLRIAMIPCPASRSGR